MNRHAVASTARLLALGLVLLDVMIWLQGRHLAPIVHERALIALVGLGFLTWWMIQGREN
jgi:hypothetical protein